MKISNIRVNIHNLGQNLSGASILPELEFGFNAPNTTARGGKLQHEGVKVTSQQG